jgi:serine/threonine protein phosphatase 1
LSEAAADVTAKETMLLPKSLKRLFKSSATAPPSVPDQTTAYAIGDVHGRVDLLLPLLEEVLARRLSSPPAVLVCLGDYVDRGPGSRSVLDALLDLKGKPGVKAHFLRGNHDQTLLDFLQDSAVGPDWCEFGGRETLASYGVTPPAGRATPEVWDTTRVALAAALPPEHLAFLRGLELTFEIGDYFFSHAGARPGVPLVAQTEQDLLWIRQPFLQDRRSFEKIVVHGHTPAEEAYADHRRIGLDTGAYATGVLSALRLEGDRRELIQAVGSPGGAVRIQRKEI